ncbi:HLH DNA binding domain protein [Aspergillus aurantiobrunneus]
MAPMTDGASQHCQLPGMRSISSISNPADMTEDRRLPPLPPIEPLQRDLFNPFTQRNFMPSPPTHESFPVKSSWPLTEHIVAPPSPANSADSWTDPVPSQRLVKWQDVSKLSPDDLMKLIAPDPKNFTRKKPLQQPCGRKRKASTMPADLDDPREKHRVAEGNRRKNLSHLHQELDKRLHDYFLQQAGWNPSKSVTESKEHIVQGAIDLIDLMRYVIIWLICRENKRRENELPRHVQENTHPQFCCMQLQRLTLGPQQQNQMAQQQINALKQEKQALEERNRALEERNRALEYQLRAREHMFPSPKSEQPSPQQAPSLPDSKPKAMLPGLRVFCDEIATSSPDSTRFDALSAGTSQPFGHHFLSQTPPTTGPYSPTFHQASYSMSSSRSPSFIPSP